MLREEYVRSSNTRPGSPNDFEAVEYPLPPPGVSFRYVVPETGTGNSRKFVELERDGIKDSHHVGTVSMGTRGSCTSAKESTLDIADTPGSPVQLARAMQAILDRMDTLDQGLSRLIQALDELLDGAEDVVCDQRSQA